METKNWHFFIVTLILHTWQFRRAETADTVKFVVECESPSGDSPSSKLLNVRVQPSLGASLLGGRKLTDSLMESSNLPKSILPVQPTDSEPIVGSGRNVHADQDAQSTSDDGGTSKGTSLFNRGDSPILSRASELIGKLRPTVNAPSLDLPGSRLLGNLRDRATSAIGEPAPSEPNSPVGLIDRLRQSVDNPSLPIPLTKNGLLHNFQTSRSKTAEEPAPREPEPSLINFKPISRIPLQLNPTLKKANDALSAATSDDQVKKTIADLTLPLRNLPLGSRPSNNPIPDSNARASQDQPINLPSLLRSNLDQPQIAPNRDFSGLTKNADTVVRDVSATIGEALTVLKKTTDGLKKVLTFPPPLPLPLNVSETSLLPVQDSLGLNTAPVVQGVPAMDNVVEESNQMQQTCDICNCLMKYIPKDVENGKFVMNDLPKLPTIQLPKLPLRLTNRNSPAAEDDQAVMANIISPAYVLPPKDMFLHGKPAPYPIIMDDGTGTEKAKELEDGIQKLIEFVNIVDQVDRYISNTTKNLITRLSKLNDDSKSQL